MKTVLFDIGIMPVGKYCNLSCRGCFQKTRKKTEFLTVDARIADHLQSMGITRCFIGGGEPLLHNDLEPVLHKISKSFSIRYLLTHGNDLSSHHYVKNYVETIVISIDPMHERATRQEYGKISYPDNIFAFIKESGVDKKVRINSVAGSLNELPFFLKLKERITGTGNVKGWYVYANTNSSISKNDYTELIDRINKSGRSGLNVEYKLPSEDFIQILILPDLSLESYSFNVFHGIKKVHVKNILSFNKLADLLKHIGKLHGKSSDVFSQMGSGRIK
ncbi:MAG: hypothetical protein UW11_C0015G0010 [Parcubacteria group bacterium GW2011_GWA2_43_9b]|nr:MAG: hypothetical protein UW11_C0015G0010 [Parcubacteria group bacterium GW2011_GWA2_43_9b]